jgi:hypothetical protein
MQLSSEDAAHNHSHELQPPNLLIKCIAAATLTLSALALNPFQKPDSYPGFYGIQLEADRIYRKWFCCDPHHRTGCSAGEHRPESLRDRRWILKKFSKRSLN